MDVAVDQEVRVTFATDAINVFDGATGALITPPEPVVKPLSIANG